MNTIYDPIRSSTSSTTPQNNKIPTTPREKICFALNILEMIGKRNPEELDLPSSFREILWSVTPVLRDIQQYIDELTQKIQAYSDLESAEKTLYDHLDKLTKQLEKSQERIKGLETSLSQAKKESQKLSTSDASLRVDLASVRKQANDLVAAKIQELELATIKFKELEEQIKTLKRSLSDEQERSQVLKRSNEKLRLDSFTFESQVVNLQNEITKLKETKEQSEKTYSSKIANLKNELSSLESSIKTLESEKASDAKYYKRCLLALSSLLVAAIAYQQLKI